MMSAKFTTVAALLVCLCLTVGIHAGKVEMRFDRFYSGPETYEALKTLQAAYPNMSELRSIGQSEEGRDIWLFTINNPATGKDTDKPGIYVDGSIHGNEIQATEVCLYLAWYLLDTYDSIPMVKELVDNRAFYIIPIVNADSRGRFFTDPSSYNIGRTGRVPYDDDHDGLYDEDDYDDLDGDGEIMQMRVKDPFGGYKTHPDDPRVMVRVEPGEKGEWRRIGREGIDNDGDGQLNEDTPGYLDMNRNYGFQWQPPYVQSGSGDFPMSGMITEAISKFILTKPNICFNFAFHNSGGMWVRGPGSKLAGMYPPSDVRVYDYLGEEGEKIVPGYRYLIGGQDMYTTHGDFDEFMFSCLGIYGFVGELFMSKQEQYRTPDDKSYGESEHAYYGGTPSEERQKFNDILTQGMMFMEWKPFKHPQYGDIEIGGWRTYTSRIPPPFLMPEMMHRNASMVMFTAGHAPEVSLEVLEVKDLGDNLHRIRVRAANKNAIPSLSRRAAGKGIVREDIMKIEGGGIEVVSGGIVYDLTMDNVMYVEHRPWMIFTTVPSFDKRDIQWIVRGSGKVTVTYDAVKAKNQTVTVSL